MHKCGARGRWVNQDMNYFFLVFTQQKWLEYEVYDQIYLPSYSITKNDNVSRQT